MIEQINFALFHLINQYSGMNSSLNISMVLIAKYIPLLVVFGMLILWLFNGKKTFIVLYGFYAFVIGLIINYVIKFAYNHPISFVIPTGALFFSYPADSSFPSDHFTIIFSIAFMFTYFKRTRLPGLIFLVLGFVGGTARVFFGVYFPMDMVGSILVSGVSVLIVLKLRNKLNSLNNFINEGYNKISLIRREAVQMVSVVELVSNFQFT